MSCERGSGAFDSIRTQATDLSLLFQARNKRDEAFYMKAMVNSLFCLTLTFTSLAAPAAVAPQTAKSDSASANAPLLSPAAVADLTLGGRQVTIHYNRPLMRGRKIMGELVPYGKVWRTGANPATSLTTAADLKIGAATIPAGSYTLYTLPSEGTWMLIINKQTGQWGTEYNQSLDLARVPMQKATLPSPQEKMSISFEDTHGQSTQLHVRWENTDVSVPVVAQ
jgi:hypothetical protein